MQLDDDDDEVLLSFLDSLKGGKRSRSTSMVSLTVETALGSFDFLDASDGEDEEEEKVPRRHGNRPVWRT